MFKFKFLLWRAHEIFYSRRGPWATDHRRIPTHAPFLDLGLLGLGPVLERVGHPEAGRHDGADLGQNFLELVAPQIGVQRGQEGVAVLLGHTRATTL